MLSPLISKMICHCKLVPCNCGENGAAAPCDHIELVESRTFLCTTYMKYNVVVKEPLDLPPPLWPAFYSNVVSCLVSYHCSPDYHDESFVFKCYEFANAVAYSTLDTFENRKDGDNSAGLMICDNNQFILTAIVVNPDKLEETLLPVYVMKLKGSLEFKNDQSILEKIEIAEKFLEKHSKIGSGNIFSKGSYKKKCTGELSNCQCGARHLSLICESVRSGNQKKVLAMEYIQYDVTVRDYAFTDYEQRMSCYNEVILKTLMTYNGKRRGDTNYAHVRIEFPNTTVVTELGVLLNIFEKGNFLNTGSCKGTDLNRKFAIHVFIFDSLIVGNILFPPYLENLKNAIKTKNLQSLLEKLEKLEMAIDKQRKSIPEQPAANNECKGDFEPCHCPRKDHLRSYVDLTPQSGFISRGLIIRRWKVALNVEYCALESDRRKCYMFVASRIIDNFLQNTSWFTNISTLMLLIIDGGRVFRAHFKPPMPDWPNSLYPLLFDSSIDCTSLGRKFALVVYVIHPYVFVSPEESKRVVDGVNAAIVAEYNEEWKNKQTASGFSKLAIPVTLHPVVSNPQTSLPQQQKPNNISILAQLMATLFEKATKYAPTSDQGQEGDMVDATTANDAQLKAVQLGCMIHGRVYLNNSRHVIGASSKTHAEFVYSMAAYQIFMVLCGDRGFYENSYLCFSIEDKGGCVFSTGLRSGSDCLKNPEITFPKNVKLKKLKGKFYLDVLIADGTQFADPRLYDLFIANLNSRLKNSGDGTTFLDKAIKAEQWLSSLVEKLSMHPGQKQIKKVPPIKINITGHSSASASTSEIDDIESQEVELLKFTNKFMTVARLYMEISQQVIRNTPNSDTAALFCKKAYIPCRKDYSELLTSKSQIMFEFRAMDGTTVCTSLIKYSELTEQLMAASVHQKLKPSVFNGKFILTFYIVQAVHADKENVKMKMLVDFFRKSYETAFLTSIAFFTNLNKDIKFKSAIIPFNECSEPYVYPCNCSEFHLRDICTVEVEQIVDLKHLALRKWLVSWTEPIISALTTNFVVSVIANRLCHIDFSGTFNAGTHLKFIFEIYSTTYETELCHYSDLTQEHLDNQLTFSQNVNLKEKVTITLFVVQTLEFASKEAAITALEDLKAGKQNITEKPARPDNTVLTKDGDDSTSTPQMPPKLLTNPWKEAPDSGSIECLIMDASTFKKNSGLAKQASATPIPVSSGYTVLSTSTKLCTSKSKIILFNISLNNQYLEEIIDDNIFISNIIMDIINKNGTGYSIRKDRRITIKLTMEGKTIQTVFNKECNPNVIKEEMFRERRVNIQKKFRLEVQFRLLK